MSLHFKKTAVTKLQLTGLFLAAAVVVSQSLFGLVNESIAHAAPFGDVVVRQTENPWTAANTSGGASSYVADSTAPYGNGALQVTTTSDNASKATRTKTVSPNVKLSDITNLSYWTKQVSASNASQTASLQLIVNGLSGTASSTTLVFEPYWNVTGSVGAASSLPSGVWQQWDVKNGVFWSTKTYASAGLTNGAGGPPFYTLNQVIAANPNAKVTSVVINIGTYNPSNVSLVDGVNLNGTVYDFEPVAPPATPVNLRLNSDQPCGYTTNVNYITPTWDAVPGAVSYNYKVTVPGGAVYGPVNVGNVTSVSGAFGGEGLSTFSIQAVGAGGITSDWAPACAVTYDATAPTATFVSSNDNGNTPTNADVTVTMTTSEPIQTPADWTAVDSTHFTHIYSDNGVNQLTITDLAGNTTGPLSFEVRNIDHQAPNITINVPPTTATPTLTGTIDDTSASITITIDGIDAVATNNGDGTWSYAVPDSLSFGTHTIVVSAVDLAGNMAAPAGASLVLVNATTTETSGGTTVDTTPAEQVAVFSPVGAALQNTPISSIISAGNGGTTNSTNNTDGQAILGTQDKESGTPLTTTAAIDTKSGKLFGLHWLWWLIIAAIVIIGWLLFAALMRRRRNEE